MGGDDRRRSQRRAVQRSPAVVDGSSYAKAGFGETVQLPACNKKIALVHPGLGAFYETTPLVAGETYTREVVLTPGSAMVRIQGGDFVAGISEAETERIRTDPVYRKSLDVADVFSEEPPAKESFLRWPQHVKTFDLDQHEVTAAEFAACSAAAKGKSCLYRECPELDGCPARWFMRGPQHGRCTLEEHAYASEAKPEHLSRPATCLPYEQAEQYCRWVGKRLATEIEWEYAARNGRDHDNPWGRDADVDCRRTGCDHELRGMPPEVCTHPGDVTLAGVCDLYAGVKEYTTPVELPGRPALRHSDPFEIRGCASRRIPFPNECWSWVDTHESVPEHLGFRCARDVE